MLWGANVRLLKSAWYRCQGGVFGNIIGLGLGDSAFCGVGQKHISVCYELVHGSRRFCSSRDIDKENDIEKHSNNSPQNEDLQENYKAVMRGVPQPVVVVTTAEQRADKTWLKRGVTCSSFTSISLRPPVISFCMNKPSRMHDLLLRRQKFAVHVLAHNQVDHGMHFAKRADDSKDQFQHIPHDLTSEGIPVLHHTAAVLQCRVHSVMGVGDHFVWYGEVTSAVPSSYRTEPLLYYARSFWSVGDEMFMQSFEQTTLPFEDWTHEAHLRMAYNYIREHGREKATPLIKSGIKRYNEQNKHKISRGYNETVTMFYITMISAAVEKMKNSPMPFDEFIQANGHLEDREFLFRYYSQDAISSRDAAHVFIKPDKKALPVR